MPVSKLCVNSLKFIIIQSIPVCPNDIPGTLFKELVTMQRYFFLDSFYILGCAGEVGPSLQTHWGLRTAYLESTTVKQKKHLESYSPIMQKLVI